MSKIEEERQGREFDVLLWGVTGWTGVHLLEYFCKNYPLDENAETNHGVKWGVVFRSPEKFEKVKALVKSEFLSIESWFDQVQSFKCSNNEEDREEISKLCRKTKSVATVVGPYVEFGEVLLSECVKNSTHYTDLTGESTWVKKMIAKYNNEALKNEVFIIPTCGVDSVPSDLLAFRAIKEVESELEARYKGEVKDYIVKKEVNSYVTIFKFNNRDWSKGGGGSGKSLFTAFSQDMKAVQKDSYMLTGKDDKARLDKKYSPQMWPGNVRTLKKLGENYKTTHFVMSVINEKVVRRSRYLLEKDYGTEFSYRESQAVSSSAMAWGASLTYKISFGMLKFPPTKYLLKKLLPAQGVIPPKLPEETEYKPGHVKLIAITNVTVNKPPQGSKKTKPEKFQVINSIELPDEPGWTETSKLMAEACLVMSAKGNYEKFRDESGLVGGIVTPACLGQTYVDKLKSKDIRFERLELPKK